MEKYVSFLRAINVGGRNVIKMAALKQLYTQIGLAHPVSYLQSGNLMFETDLEDETELSEKIRSAVEVECGFRPRVILRTVPELSDIIANNPFPRPALNDPGHLLVMLLQNAVSEVSVAALKAANKASEECVVRGREVYLHYPNGIGRSKFTNVVIERALGAEGTARNWNTLTKLLEMSAGN